MKGHEARNFVRELLAYGQGQSRKVENFGELVFR